MPVAKSLTKRIIAQRTPLIIERDYPRSLLHFEDPDYEEHLGHTAIDLSHSPGIVHHLPGVVDLVYIPGIPLTRVGELALVIEWEVGVLVTHNEVRASPTMLGERWFHGLNRVSGGQLRIGHVLGDGRLSFKGEGLHKVHLPFIIGSAGLV